ncbi:MAG: hypothetical protein H0X25_16725, partial [Acidobacteriales bacterium]|nr:hypothetical protein [Terriglobales bacterium]
IQALDVNGIPDPNGKKVFLIIGESNVEIEAEAIVRDANLDASRDPHVVVVNGGMGNETSVYLQNPNSGFWSTINNFILPNYGVTPAQVVAIWAEPNDALTSGTYPTDINAIEGELKTEIQNFLLKYPNLKMAYLSSRTYSGYSNGISKTNPEPYAYEVGFAMREVILDQINGDLALNFDPSKGTVVAPWLSWGPYYWADGLTVPSGNGTVWSCQDSQADGTHPGRMAASEKVANAVMNMLHTDTTAAPWYLTPPQ